VVAVGAAVVVVGAAVVVVGAVVVVVVHLQLPGVCEPARSAAHLPADESQLQHVGGGSVQQSLMAFDTPQASNVTVPPLL
jgi:hypothetical protein